MTTSIANFTDTAAGWQRALYAFLADSGRLFANAAGLLR